MAEPLTIRSSPPPFPAFSFTVPSATCRYAPNLEHGTNARRCELANDATARGKPPFAIDPAPKLKLARDASD
jgi:hypothetical protein